MTAPDSRPIHDVIAKAVAAALPDALQPVGAGLRNPPEMGGDLTGYGQQIVDAVTPAVLAACRQATVEQQAELTGGEVESVQYGAVDAGPGWHRQSRLVGPWREDPS